MNSPGTDKTAAATYATGPKGSCGSLAGSAQQSCIAYNYGVNGAKSALSYARKANVSSSVWWVDIENSTLSSNNFSNEQHDAFWSASPALNALTVQGAIDALRQAGILVGIYSTSIQYPKIVGNFVPSGGQVLLWVAGAPWTNPPYTEKGLPPLSKLAPWCAGTATYPGSKTTDLFAGGIPWILQETPGTEASPYGIDPNYTC